MTALSCIRRRRITLISIRSRVMNSSISWSRGSGIGWLTLYLETSSRTSSTCSMMPTSKVDVSSPVTSAATSIQDCTCQGPSSLTLGIISPSCAWSKMELWQFPLESQSQILRRRRYSNSSCCRRSHILVTTKSYMIWNHKTYTRQRMKVSFSSLFAWRRLNYSKCLMTILKQGSSIWRELGKEGLSSEEDRESSSRILWQRNIRFNVERSQVTKMTNKQMRT